MALNRRLASDLLDSGDEELSKSANKFYNIARRMVNLTKQIKEANAERTRLKKELLEEFTNIPKEYTYVARQSPTKIAEQTFQRETKTISFNDVSVIIKQRVDTNLSRKRLYEILDSEKKRNRNNPEAEAAVDSVKSQVDSMLSPHITDVIETERPRAAPSKTRPTPRTSTRRNSSANRNRNFDL